MKKLIVAATGLAALGLAGPAMAAGATDTFNVDVNIQVAEEVSFWTNLSTVNLVLDGANAENSAAVQATLSHINNVKATIGVTVSGVFPDQANFFIFDQVTAPDAIAAITANSNNPAGALKWTAPDNTPKTLATVDVSGNISNRILTYAASAPNFLPAPDNYALVVTYTMTGI
jgi:hypothetical protein